ncbi:phage gp6-like head-tail connector protein [Streptococcus sp. BJSWXB6CM1]|uniref:Phage gp6-like head-tail connector protein n=1 Tax=Streptococcus fermentans TaxID=3095082 RepID=A0ABU5FZK5_9STRE|nr:MULTISPECIES: phage gp6-like head-tail connector protein [unclassified Streptococcus]MDY4346574.1 phage gp6-like head-tail connector protein [Streptococcus sp. BJSWXB5TM5]MDY4360856.1 phage gp6-like head-tail connector protein [Streptococcus sp. BJSWXB3CM3]MDY4371170.1 phage gp6-like head-tail connector protein [Streptococcus sp. BJSWXB6CM1]
MTTEEQLHPLLKSFKERMKIFHNGEDENISRILESSEAYILKTVGSQDISDPRIKELVQERARYVYNDQVEFFYENFQGDLMMLSLENYEPEEKHD